MTVHVRILLVGLTRTTATNSDGVSFSLVGLRRKIMA
jgi:hypothetical protein